MKIILILIAQIICVSVYSQNITFKIDTTIDDFSRNVTIKTEEVFFSDTSFNKTVNNAIALMFGKANENYVISIIVFSKEYWQCSSENRVYYKLSSGEVIERPIAFQTTPKMKEILGWGYGWGSGIACAVRGTDLKQMSTDGIEKIRITTGDGIEFIDFTVYSEEFQNKIQSVLQNFVKEVIEK